jgi:hypothetical protein
MSTNCIRCVINKRNGPDLLCGVCRDFPHANIKKFQEILIKGFEEACVEGDIVYNPETAAHAIKSASHAILESLNKMSDEQILRFVRHIATTLPL